MIMISTVWAIWLRRLIGIENQRYKSDIGQPVKTGNVYLYDTPYETDYHITCISRR